MERIYPDKFDSNMVRAITEIPNEPEKVLLGLNRFPGVQVDRLPVSADIQNKLRRRMLEIRESVGHLPLALIICHAGISRSQVVSRWLFDNNLATVGRPNLDLEAGDVIGCGYEYLEDYGLGINDNGLSIVPDRPGSVDAVILNFAVTPDRTGDRRTLTQFALILETLLKQGLQPKKPLSVIWLEGDEDAFEKGFLPPST